MVAPLCILGDSTVAVYSRFSIANVTFRHFIVLDVIYYITLKEQ